jgi:hypothetical protein
LVIALDGIFERIELVRLLLVVALECSDRCPPLVVAVVAVGDFVFEYVVLGSMRRLQQVEAA